MTDLVVAKFGGTSVADFDAMNRSIDVALLDAIPVLLCSPPLPA
ncbi:Aspartokinase [Klebsiella pneumoniae]|uniref:Aspartokinase n=1 Tax=Klebsiella pneumoniae TaxID=573 RepID=A0A377TLE5_KLEPN|nr:Aspartokinase [Klebsiella pneumoniae]